MKHTIRIIVAATLALGVIGTVPFVPAISQNVGLSTTGSVTNGNLAVFIDRFHVKDGGTPSSVAPVQSVFGRTGNVTATSGDYSVGQVTGAAPLNSPALTGVPTAPTAAPGTNTTQLATTAYADAIAALKANINSPTFTGVPAAPTAAPGTNTTQLATTAFVLANTTTLPTIASGHLIANSGAGSAQAADTVPTTWLDRAFCSTVGQLITRTTGAWVCAKGIPANVTWWGAVGDGVTDNSAAFAAAISAVNSAPYYGGRIMVPSSGQAYCLFTGVTLANNVMLEGEFWLSTTLSPCNHNVSTVVMNGTRVTLREMFVFGYNKTDAAGTTAAVKINSSCVDCMVNHVYAAFGYAVVNNAGVDTNMQDNILLQAMGVSVVENSGGALWMRRNKIDQSWPVSLPSVGASFAARANSTAYAAGDVRSFNGYYFQVNTAGTSGASAPVGPYQYNTLINDGTVQWYLVGGTDYAGLRLDGGTTEAHITTSDFTGSYTSSIIVSTDNGGAAPYLIFLDHNVMSQTSGPAINVKAGSAVFITENEITSGVAGNNSAINFQGTWAGDAVIANNIMWGSNYCVYVPRGVNTNVVNNVLGCSSFGAVFDTNVSYFNYVNNVPSTKFSGNNNVTVVGGTTGHCTITGNIGATVTDAGSLCYHPAGSNP